MFSLKTSFFKGDGQIHPLRALFTHCTSTSNCFLFESVDFTDSIDILKAGGCPEHTRPAVTGSALEKFELPGPKLNFMELSKKLCVGK